MDGIVNKVAESGILTLNLEQFIPDNMASFDLKPFLFMELILKEKDFRAALLTHDWNQYHQKSVALFCSVDAIIPVWAYMLVTHYLQPHAARVLLANSEQARTQWTLDAIQDMDSSAYVNQRVVIKGCGEVAIPDAAYVAVTAKLRPVVRSLMYGEPCSTVPIFKQKNQPAAS